MIRASQSKPSSAPTRIQASSAPLKSSSGHQAWHIMQILHARSMFSRLAQYVDFEGIYATEVEGKPWRMFLRGYFISACEIAWEHRVKTGNAKSAAIFSDWKSIHAGSWIRQCALPTDGFAALYLVYLFTTPSINVTLSQHCPYWFQTRIS